MVNITWTFQVSQLFKIYQEHTWSSSKPSISAFNPRLSIQVLALVLFLFKGQKSHY